jgi:hypothetical protein
MAMDGLPLLRRLVATRRMVYGRAGIESEKYRPVRMKEKEINHEGDEEHEEKKRDRGACSSWFISLSILFSLIVSAQVEKYGSIRGLAFSGGEIEIAIISGQITHEFKGQ